MRTLLLLLAAVSLLAQDAGMSLRTSVGYRTLKASRALSDEQRAEADRLEALARQASAAGKYGEAMRHWYHGMAVMNGAAWTPALEFASSLQARAERSVAAPGQTIRVRLIALYPSDRAAEEPLTAAVVLRSSGATLAEPHRIRPVAIPATLAVRIPDSVSGDQFLEVRLSGAQGEVDSNARSSFTKAVPIHIADLEGPAARLRSKLGALRSESPAIPTAAYVLDLFDRAQRGDLNPHRIDFPARFGEAESIADAIAGGRDPLAGRKGNLYKAYRSPVDNTLQPYRLFVPDQYDAAKPAALVVALHGMGGDENSMLDGYAGALPKHAARLGFLIAAPKGRDSASMYIGAGEKDVLDVLAEVRRDYQVDPSRIYLMGHSMGGYGTWSIAMRHPGIWAALGPIAGGGNPGGMTAIRHIPQYVVHGDNDKTVPVSQSRTMVEAGRKAGAEIKYVEVPGGGHGDIAIPNFGPMFDYFAAHPKPQAAPAGAR